MSHRRVLTLLILLPLLQFAAPATAAGKKYALLVGVRHYDDPNVKPLQYTENDVIRMADVLRADGYEVILLTGTTGRRDSDFIPTKARIERQLTQLLNRCTREDLVLVGLSGHGVQFAGKSQAYFCPQDAMPLAKHSRTLVSLEAVYRQLGDSSAGVKLLLVDACRSDPRGGQARGIDGSAPENMPPRGVYALFSCSAGEQSFEHRELMHGVFFHYVLEGLKGAAKDSSEEVSFSALSDYVSKRVPKRAARLFDGARQTPMPRVLSEPGPSPVIVSLRNDDLLVSELREYRAALGRGKVRDFLRQRSEQRLSAWRGAAERGLSTGALLYGRSLQFGIGVTADQDGAIRWLRAAAENGLDASQNALGVCYQRGDGVAKDDTEAVNWFRKGAEQGLAAAQFNLGVAYHHGVGIEKNEEEAANWYRKAAASGLAVSQYKLACCYWTGQGVRKDRSLAVHWYRRAAEQGHGPAQYCLGVSYHHGEGVEHCRATARAWYTKAARAGSRSARTALVELERRR